MAGYYFDKTASFIGDGHASGAYSDYYSSQSYEFTNDINYQDFNNQSNQPLPTYSSFPDTENRTEPSLPRKRPANSPINTSKPPVKRSRRLRSNVKSSNSPNVKINSPKVKGKPPKTKGKAATIRVIKHKILTIENFDSLEVSLPCIKWENESFVCKLCDSNSFNPMMLKEHIESNDHRNKLKSSKLLQCEDCSCKCISLYNFINHINGKKHQSQMSKESTEGYTNRIAFSNFLRRTLQDLANGNNPVNSELVPPIHHGNNPVNPELVPTSHHGNNPVNPELVPPSHHGNNPVNPELVPPSHHGNNPINNPKPPNRHGNHPVNNPLPNVEDIFRNAKGPIIGLSYGLIDSGGVSIGYDCVLCGVSVDTPRKWIDHFESHGHTAKVLELDYKDQYTKLCSNNRNRRHRLEQIYNLAYSIEQTEGRQTNKIRTHDNIQDGGITNQSSKDRPVPLHTTFTTIIPHPISDHPHNYSRQDSVPQCSYRPPPINTAIPVPVPTGPLSLIPSRISLREFVDSFKDSDKLEIAMSTIIQNDDDIEAALQLCNVLTQSVMCYNRKREENK